jgi:hypothetical protein
LHFITAQPPDWPAFYAACDDDTPIWEVITVARALKSAGHIVVQTTGRSDVVREQTRSWLRKYRVPSDELYMRKDGDYREDAEVKSEMLDSIKHNWAPLKLEIGGVFEDRQQCVDMYRARGLRAFQVAKGNF